MVSPSAAASRTRHQVLCDFRRQEILSAARKLFARKGFDGTTMDDVAVSASIAKGTLYLYFRSKRQIYLAVLKRDVLDLRHETQRAIDAAPGTAAKISAFIATRIEYCERHRDFFKIYHAEIGKLFLGAQSLHKDLKELYFEQARQLAAVLSEGIRASEIRDVVPETTAFAIYDMTRGLIAKRLLGLSTASPAEDTSAILSLVWRGIGKSVSYG